MLIKNNKFQCGTLVLQNEIKKLTPTWTNPYINAATSDNTRKAYQADIRHFELWGGLLPANPEIIIDYLQTFADKLNPRTLARRVTAIKNWHTYQNFPDPTSHPAIAKTLSGILRTHGIPKEKAPPLLPEQLLQIVTYLEQQNNLRGIRDNALLQIGFFGAFRRSELVAIQYEHIQWQEKGIEILIPHSKTDQEHQGQFCAIPYGHSPLCPISALKHWLEKSGIKSDYIFRAINNNQVHENKSLHPLVVNQILKRRAKKAGNPNANNLSSHSLRRYVEFRIM